MFKLFSCIKGTHHEGGLAIYCLQLILILNLRTNTNEWHGTRTRVPNLPVQYRTNEPTIVPLQYVKNFMLNKYVTNF